MRGERARHLLRSVSNQEAFGSCTGEQLYRVEDLLWWLTHYSEEEYKQHVYFNHNDFSNWILNIIGDQTLGLDMFHAHKRQAESLVRARIMYVGAQTENE